MKTGRENRRDATHGLLFAEKVGVPLSTCASEPEPPFQSRLARPASLMEAATAPKSVLVVENDAHLRGSLSISLRLIGFQGQRTAPP